MKPQPTDAIFNKLNKDIKHLKKVSITTENDEECYHRGDCQKVDVNGNIVYCNRIDICRIRRKYGDIK